MNHSVALEREYEDLKIECAVLREENDIQRQAIQNLSYQIVTLQGELDRLLNISNSMP